MVFRRNSVDLLGRGDEDEKLLPGQFAEQKKLRMTSEEAALRKWPTVNCVVFWRTTSLLTERM